ncbi:MAG: hypothetical protein PVSMB2_25030 [Ktedonobacteraceae bacterium]
MAKTDRIQLKYNLAFMTPFHCGTDVSSGFADQTVVRDAGGSLYVPGSTFKGVVRSRCEQLARLYTLREGMQTRQRASSRDDGTPTVHAMDDDVTMVTRIFGSRNRPGLLFFDDARRSEDVKQRDDGEGQLNRNRDKYRNEQTSLSMRVQVDRSTRTAVRNAFYMSEFGLRNSTFSGGISGWLSCTSIPEMVGEPSYSILLLLAGLRMLDQLGGRKSIGKGQCTCEITEVSINGVVFANTIWQSWLEHLEVLTLYSQRAARQEEGE